MKVKNKSYLYQHGTLGGLMQDLMDGTEQIGKMLEYGNFGSVRWLVPMGK